MEEAQRHKNHPATKVTWGSTNASAIIHFHSGPVSAFLSPVEPDSLLPSLLKKGVNKKRFNVSGVKSKWWVICTEWHPSWNFGCSKLCVVLCDWTVQITHMHWKKNNLHNVVVLVCAVEILFMSKLFECESVWAHTVGSQHTGSLHVVPKVKGY